MRHAAPYAESNSIGTHAVLSTDTLPLSRLHVADAMRMGVVTCEPGDGLVRLASLLVTRGVHMLVLAPADAESSRTVGALDVVRAAIAADDARAKELAREPATMVASHDTLERATVIMADQFVRHLLVIDPGSRAPIGALSSFDIAAVLAGQQPRVVRTLRPAPAQPMPSGSLREVRARDAMHPGIVACRADAPLLEACRVLAQHRVHCVAVTGVEPKTGRLTWGLLSDIELILAVQRTPADEPAAALARSRPVAVEESDSLEDAARLMVEHDTSHVVVVGASGLPSGMLSTIDVARVLAAAAD